MEVTIDGMNVFGGVQKYCLSDLCCDGQLRIGTSSGVLGCLIGQL